MQNFDQEIDEILSMALPPLIPLPPGGYVVYGAGNIGREIAAKLAGRERKVRAFLDLRPLGSVGEIPVYAPDSSEARQFAAEGMTAVIGVFNYAADPHAIRLLLEGLGYRRIVTFPEFREQFNLPDHFWLSSRDHVVGHKDKVRAAYNLLCDEKSREIFFGTLWFRLSLDMTLLRQPETDQQYWPDDLPRPKMPLRLIDGGAFDGDTIEFLLGKGATFEAVAAFEPDPKNYQALRATVGKHIGKLGDVTLWPCGLSDTSSVASFSAGNDQASVIAGQGNMHIQLVALDDALPAFRPTYLKFDIEGSELAALRGASRMIHEHQPAIAVCVYHRPDDLWEIPLYLREILPTHNIALRYHKFQGFDMVVYALPASA